MQRRERDVGVRVVVTAAPEDVTAFSRHRERRDNDVHVKDRRSVEQPRAVVHRWNRQTRRVPVGAKHKGVDVAPVGVVDRT